MQTTYDIVVAMTDAFCDDYLNAEGDGSALSFADHVLQPGTPDVTRAPWYQ
jgi:hypothetical protein